MKKLVVLLIVLLMVSSSLVVNASGQRGGSPNMNQGQNRSTTARYDNFFEKREENQVRRLDKVTKRWEERLEKREAVMARHLEIIKLYAPELLEDYEVAFEDHKAVHRDSMEVRTAIAKDYMDETKAGLEELKAEIEEKIEAEEITTKEAKEMIKTYMLERREGFKTLFDTYLEAIAEEKEAYEVLKDEAEALKIELRAAIEAEDADRCNELLTELYDYLLLHIEFDQLKLDTLNNIF
ncbi:hypothetical protein [Petrocella sp. FN5]|uniref:hypothetical protein n=1 Tax=Petrocella sp. FN5 TaxID=3032002 RepID=UPI0023DA1027|nr:hypothetical protein [Petrocella sp. FN5]MDF1617371.1 hypothetical protein [Petrocella sp. FN5]